MKSSTSSLRRVLLSPSFSDFFQENGPSDMMDEDAISNLSIRLKISLTVWDFVLPETPSVPAVIGVSFVQCLFYLTGEHCRIIHVSSLDSSHYRDSEYFHGSDLCQF